MFDCIIVGAGAAGLIAARILSAEGKKILLLEAQDRPGGRINTITNEFSFKVEGGAEFIHGNLETTLQLLKEARLGYAKTGGEIISVEKGEWKLQNAFIEDWGLLQQRLEELKADITIAGFLTKYFPEEKHVDLRKSFIGYVEGYDAADINFTSSFAIREEMKKEEVDNFRVNECYGSLIDFLAEECKRYDCIIKLSEPVIQINWQINNVEVITNTNAYYARKVLITIPIGVLQSNEDAIGVIKFSPSLDVQIEAAKQIGFGNVIKILIEFENAFWFEKKLPGSKKFVNPFFIFKDTFIPTWWTQYPSKTPLLTGWLAGTKANDSKNMPDEEIFRNSINSLASIFNVGADEIVRKLKHHKILNWINEPFIKGGYSYPTLTTKKAQRVLQTAVENTIYFAGEALAQNSTATVDAALRSGKEAAEAMCEL